jgi:hypothetical protein
MIWKIDRKERNGLKEFSDLEFNHKGPSAAEPQPKFGLSPAKTQRPQRSEK